MTRVALSEILANVPYYAPLILLLMLLLSQIILFQDVMLVEIVLLGVVLHSALGGNAIQETT